jgi:site-specific recombinase XerD
MFLFKNKQNGNYYVYYSINGKRQKKSCKTKLKSDALRFIQDFKFEPPPLKSISRNFNTLKVEALKYAQTNFKNKTVFEYENVSKLFSKIAGDKDLSNISMLDAELYKTFRLKSVKPATLNKDIGTLRAIFNYGMKLKWVFENPFNLVNKISLSDRERLAFNNYEIDSLMNEIYSSSIKSFILFALYTGCRLNEIINLQFKDIDFHNELITIRNKDGFNTKSGKIRQIPMNKSIRELVRTMYSKDNIIELDRTNIDCYVFQKLNGYKYNPDYITHKFKKYLRCAGISEKFHFHCLRHTFITRLINAGVNLNYVKEIAGHASIQTTMKYIHLSTEDLKSAVNNIRIC